MVSLGHLLLFVNLGKVSCFQFCSFLTENGWLSVDSVNGFCFNYYNKPSNWWDAKRSCEQQGLFLARPDNEVINEYIQNELRDSRQSVWIGGINQEDSGWKWSNGGEMDFTDFDLLSGTVNRVISLFKKTTFCAMYRPSDFDFKWVMKSCDDLAPYLCQSGRNTTLATVEKDERLDRTRFSDRSTKFCEPTSGPESLRFNSSAPSCFVFFEERLSWWDANKSCQEQKMSLVTVSNKYIDSMLNLVRYLLIIDFWIGAINKDNTGWKWGNGEDTVYTNFDGLIVTWDRMFKQTLCGVQAKFGWAKYGCDNHYPFMCQFYSYSSTVSSRHVEIHEQTTSAYPISTIALSRNQRLHEETTSASPNLTITDLLNSEIREQTTSASSPKAGATNTKQRVKTFKVMKKVGGRLHPKLIHPGQRNLTSSNMIHCCRICSHDNVCEAVNFCKISRSCVLYGNFHAAVNGGVSSELGCSIYVDVDKVD